MFTLGITLASQGKISPPTAKDNKLNGTARFMVAGLCMDTLISISALAIGIIGLLGIIPGMPPVAGFALIALNVAITSSWLTLVILFQKYTWTITKVLLCAAVSSKPEEYFNPKPQSQHRVRV